MIEQQPPEPNQLEQDNKTFRVLVSLCVSLVSALIIVPIGILGLLVLLVLTGHGKSGGLEGFIFLFLERLFFASPIILCLALIIGVGSWHLTYKKVTPWIVSWGPRTKKVVGGALLGVVVVGTCALTPTAAVIQALPRVPKEERAALETFYESTSGEGWQANTGWGSWKSPCRWQGVFCRDEGGQWFRHGGSLFSTLHIGSLFLDENRLSGTIPPELDELPYLENLDLRKNQLTGGMPPELGRLVNLETVRLGGNQLTGNLPPEWSALANLTILCLENNQLTGSVPPEWGALVSLELFRLSGNQLTGPIPPELGALANLEELNLSGNQLTGPIPPELGALSSLKYLHLHHNQLSGSIPPELGDLPNLFWLYLDHNPLSGGLPVELSNLPKVTKFHFDDTDLCEPSDADFQEWLAEIRELGRTGIICP